MPAATLKLLPRNTKKLRAVPGFTAWNQYGTFPGEGKREGQLKSMAKILWLAAAAAAALVGAAPAGAAQFADRAEQACMMGAPLPMRAVDETRVYTSTSMATYALALGASGREANVQRAWQSDDSRGRWRSAGTEIGYNRLTNVTDPFVASGARIDPAPIAYVRSGDGELVEGLWTAHNHSGVLAGVYDATFTRVEGVWRLHSLNLLQPSEAPADLAQFCHQPGDVAAYRASWEARQRQTDTKRAGRSDEGSGGGR